MADLKNTEIQAGYDELLTMATGTAPAGIEDGDGVDATGQIVTSGSNSDGSWVKYADGTMICHLTATLTWGSAERLRDESVTYPQAFNAAPRNTCVLSVASMAGTGGGALDTYVHLAVVRSTTSASTCVVELYRQKNQLNFQSGDTADVFVTAIGTWK